MSSKISENPVIKNKVESGGKKMPDINLCLPHTRPHMCTCIQTHVYAQMKGAIF